MKVVRNLAEMRSAISVLKSSDSSIGLVPTMGALHKGHISLVEKSCQENDACVVSIFVNPTQFDKQEDLVNYPNTIDRDLEALQNTACKIVFIPNANEIYDNTIVSEQFSFDGLENEMEGKYRNGHFDGVGTIVKKLFELSQPTRAYFGEKDFQQLQIVKKLNTKENLGIEIIGCPIFREPDGLAMSSRNARLTATQRAEAPFIYEVLKTAAKKFKTEDIDSVSKWVTAAFQKNKSLELEYFEIANEETLKTATQKNKQLKYRAFIAVFAGSIRLIDNISL